MREQFEINTNQTGLTVVRDADRVRYIINDGDTIMNISTDDPTNTEDLKVSKYNNAHIRVVVTIELDDTEYENITL